MSNIPQSGGECSRADSITLSPFYHSAVNAVTRPNQATWCSDYFIDRWMPILGNEGTRIVLALRRRGYNNRRTGVKREEIQMDRAELAALVGCSEDTITRQLGENKATGKPHNPWLHLFVRKFEHKRQDPRTGQIRQEVNGYWVAMDDPVHPDDWTLVEEYVHEQEALKEKGQGPGSPLRPGTQNASSVADPKTQNASDAPQNASDAPQNASPGTQNASRNKVVLDSYLLLETPMTLAAPGDSLSLFEEGETPAAPEEDPPAVRAAIRESMPAPKVVTLQTLETEWKAMPPGEKDLYRPEALRQLQAKGYGSPPEKMVEPTMFKLFWVERKGL